MQCQGTHNDEHRTSSRAWRYLNEGAYLRWRLLSETSAMKKRGDVGVKINAPTTPYIIKVYNRKGLK